MSIDGKGKDCLQENNITNEIWDIIINYYRNIAIDLCLENEKTNSQVD